MTNRNSCYTYFKITGNFNPDEISSILGLTSEKQWCIGDKRLNGTAYDFALWEIGRCTDYNVLTEKQMEKTIELLVPKIDLLKQIKKEYDVDYTLEIVPTVYVNETTPCLAPSDEIIRFCYETDTRLDIDLYVSD